jgi:hypothetical protein
MRLLQNLLRAALPAILIVHGMVSPVAAGQRTGRLAVSVQVVDSCTSTTAGSGIAGQACGGNATPIAIVRETAGVAAAAQSQTATPLDRTQDAPGLVTVIY